MIGQRIGCFEVTSRLGSGAMGEVYRARDTRLGRDVAIKLLAPAFTRDPERVARFDREARVLASLNHSHIGGIYSIENHPDDPSPGARALVLELVEGDTLAERIEAAARQTAGGGLRYDEAIAVARQVAAALDAAHEKGVVHRDLKPANIKVTPAGVVKVLDFGLATTVEPAEPSSEPSTMTTQGAFIGTPAYMSPEQARGQTVDKRADIWAFGCILYEMLTGRQPFGGPSISDTVVAILDREPDWSRLPPETTAPVRRLLRRCLAKDLTSRLRDIGDSRLNEPADPVAFDSGPSHRTVQFQRLTDSPGLNSTPAVSPDGRMVAFVATAGARRQIHVLLLAGGQPLQITHDDLDHEHPRWTPDSSAIIYYTRAPIDGEPGTVWEVPALGGQPRPLIASAGPADISRAGDRLALFRFDGRHRLVTAARDGSDVRVVTDAPTPEPCIVRWSPDDRALLFHARVVHNFEEHVFLVDSAGGVPRPVVRASSIRGIAWLPDGAGFVYSSSADSAVPYPPNWNLRLAGRDGSGDRQLTFGDISYIDPDVHGSGRLVTARLRTESDIWRIPVDGDPAANTAAARRITRQTGQVQTPCVSPDGRSIAYLSDRGGHANIWIASADGSATRQLTFERDPSITMGLPLWSPSGRHIVFVLQPGRIGLWIVAPDGRGLRSLVPGALSAAWAPDGRWLYYVRVLDDGPKGVERIAVDSGAIEAVTGESGTMPLSVSETDLYVAARVAIDGVPTWELRRWPLDGGPHRTLARIPPERLPLSPFVTGTLSPDGRRLALPLLDGATTDIWAVPADGGEMERLTDFASEPTLIARRVSWWPDSRSLAAAVARVNSDVILLDGLLPR